MEGVKNEESVSFSFSDESVDSLVSSNSPEKNKAKHEQTFEHEQEQKHQHKQEHDEPKQEQNQDEEKSFSEKSECGFNDGSSTDIYQATKAPSLRIDYDCTRLAGEETSRHSPAPTKFMSGNVLFVFFHLSNSNHK